MTEHVPQVTPELPSFGWRAILAALSRLPQAGMSRGLGRIADTPVPPALRNGVIGGFARIVGINVDEAEHAVSEYGSINQFFVRRLKPGVRAWPARPDIPASPVDGIVGQFGEIHDGRLLQAKGRWYTAAGLLDDADEAARFDGGTFVTIYLSPRHYHRIHTPTPGFIDKARHVPGALLPVNEAAVLHVDELFARNERLICYVNGAAGRIAVAAIGAYNVGRISAAFDPEWRDANWVTNIRNAKAETKTYDPPVPVETGAEIMAFHLGSTVVLLFERGRVQLEHLEPGMEVRVGQPIARGRAAK